MLKVAAILKGKTVSRDVDLSISPGSRQVLTMLSECGALEDILQAGQDFWNAPAVLVSAWAFPLIPKVSACAHLTEILKAEAERQNAQVYLVSPETAAASALTGYITDPRDIGSIDVLPMPKNLKSM